MMLRVARHTKDLEEITKFYRDLIGLDVLGSFKNHKHYDGVFLGFSDCNWQLEFTSSNDLPNHQFDEDDLLVFYFSSIEELNRRKNRLISCNFHVLKPKNPYWNENGFYFKDPDGFGVILALNP